MLMRTVIHTALATALLGAGPAFAKPLPVEELASITPWNVNWANQSCVLLRGFGSKEQRFILKFERFAPGDHLQLVLTGRQLGKLDQTKRMSITYGSGGYVHANDSAMTGELPDGTPSVFITSTSLAAVPETPYIQPTITPEQETLIREISLERFRNKRIVLKTGSLGAAMASLRKCTDQLVQSWGLDPVQQSQLRHGPTPKSSPGTWLRSDDYPSVALERGGQSIVNFRLNVDATGQVTDCKVQSSYSGKDFDKISCETLTRRAKFEPALDAAGRSVASYYVSRVRWMLP